jgi:hypothetical protein
MGLFDNLFGGRKSYTEAIKRMERGYGEARTFASTEYKDLIDSFLKERTANAEVYSKAFSDTMTKYATEMQRTRQELASRAGIDLSKFEARAAGIRGAFGREMGGAVSNYEKMLAASQAEFRKAGAEAYKTLEAGRESTLALLRQQTEAAVAKTTASSVLTGLSNTTFGQSAINAVAAQGALQAGAVQEQYAQTLYAAQQAQANALANMQSQQAQGLLAARGGMAQMLAGMDQQTAQAAFASQTGLTSNLANLQAQQAQSQFGAGLTGAQYQSGQYQQYTAAAQAARAASLQAQLGLMTRPIEARYAAETQKAMMDMQAGNQLGGALLGAGIGAIAEGVGQGVGNIISPFGQAFQQR